MKKKLISLSLIILFILSILFIYMNYNNSHKIVENITLKNKIIEKIENSKELDFSNISTLSWDKMYIFSPYSDPNSILNNDNIKTYNKEFSIQYLDSIYMISFVDKGKLVSFVNLPIKYIKKPISVYVKFLKDETTFNISQDKSLIISK